MRRAKTNTSAGSRERGGEKMSSLLHDRVIHRVQIGFVVLLVFIVNPDDEHVLFLGPEGEGAGMLGEIFNFGEMTARPVGQAYVVYFHRENDEHGNGRDSRQRSEIAAPCHPE